MGVDQPSACIRRDLVRIPEALLRILQLVSTIPALIGHRDTYSAVLKLNLAPIRLLVLTKEIERQQCDHEEGQEAACDATVQTIVVLRRILGAENQAASNTSNASETNQGRRTEGSLPLATNVIRLVCHGSGYVAVCSGRRQEDTKVANTGTLRPAHDGQTNQAQNHVKNDLGWSVSLLRAMITGEKNSL